MGSGDATAARAEFARAVDLSEPDDLVRPHALAALAVASASARLASVPNNVGNCSATS